MTLCLLVGCHAKTSEHTPTDAGVTSPDVGGTSCDTGHVLVDGACVPLNVFAASYFDNTSLAGSPVVTRMDPAVNFRWGFGDPGTSASPDPAIPTGQWSARWLGYWSFPVSTTYRFYATTDDGIRLLVDGNLVIDKWLDQGETTYTADTAISAGVHTIEVRYYNNTGAAMAVVSWALRPDDLLAAEKARGCTADSLLWSGPGEIAAWGRFGLPGLSDFEATIARSSCALLNRSIETWFVPPDFAVVQSRMNTMATLSGGKSFIYSLNIAEALLPGVVATWHDAVTNTDLSIADMCQAGTAPNGHFNHYGLDGSCVPSYFSLTYQRYLESITQQAIDLGVRDFVFGEMDLPDSKVIQLDSTGALANGWLSTDDTWETTPIYPQLLARLRAYAASKGVAITIGCQKGDVDGFDWASYSHLKLCDYKYSPLLTGVVDAPHWTPAQWADPAAASDWSRGDWNNPAITSQTSVLADFEWWGATDDMTLYSQRPKVERAAFAFHAAQMLRAAGQGLLLPFAEPVSGTSGSLCAAIPQYTDGTSQTYSPSAAYCGDEDVLNDALAGLPIYLFAESSHVASGGSDILRWYTPVPNTCTVYGSGFALWLDSDWGDTSTYGPLTASTTYTLQCPNGAQAQTTVFVP